MFVPRLLVLLCLVAVTGRAADHPNILWLVSEDYSAGFSGPYGDSLARTPHLDRLAADGIVLLNAHSSAPVCAPTRFSIITGRYAQGQGAQHMRSAPALAPGVQLFPALLRAAGYYCTNNAKTDYNTSAPLTGVWDESSRTAHWRHRAPGQPFFAIFNFEQSHESRLHTREPLVTDPARVRVPGWLPDTPTVRADLAQYYDCVARADEAAGRILAQLEADGLAEDTIVIYYSDNGGSIPRSKRFLYDNGTHIAMVLHFPEKYRHLAPAAPGSRLPEPVNTVDLAPTMLSLAGLDSIAAWDGRALAGPHRAPAPEFTFLMRDRMDERYELSRAVTDGRYRYLRNYQPGVPWGQSIAYLWLQASMQEWSSLHRSGRLTPAQDAFFQPKPAEELYDCAADPDNIRNLAGDPASHAELRRFRAALRQHQLAIRDTGFLPEPMLQTLAGDGSPALPAADEDRYPLTRLLPLLDDLQLAATPDPATVRAALADPVPVIRYWGAACSRDPADLNTLTALLVDAEPCVRLAAAEAILRQRDDSAAWAVLEQAVRTPDLTATRLLALNVAARVPQPLPTAWAELLAPFAADHATSQGMDSYVSRAAAALLAAP